MAVSLHERGLFAWDEFRERLIAEISRWEREHPGARTAEQGYRYYERWLAALERLLADKGLCNAAELEQRTREFEARPRGHDHGKEAGESRPTRSEP